MSNRLIAIVVGLVSVLVLSACDNTIRGVGRDVQETGNAVEDATN